jgi:hypothetical protein
VLDLSVREHRTGLAVVLNNLSNPMMMKGPIREVYPAGRQEVSIAIPSGKSFGGAELLVAGGEAQASVADGRVTVVVPSISTIEVVYVTWA